MVTGDGDCHHAPSTFLRLETLGNGGGETVLKEVGFRPKPFLFP